MISETNSFRHTPSNAIVIIVKQVNASRLNESRISVNPTNSNDIKGSIIFIKCSEKMSFDQMP